ncbi:MAG: hypothetical protein M3144_03155, partial [Actinomycetota bacterium]|nr:hypothetical protein [Actinomycetota bacterium]
MPREAGPTPTLSVETASAAGTLSRDERADPDVSSPVHAWRAVFLFLAFAAFLFGVGGLALTYLPYDDATVRPHPFPGRPWLGAWVHWDGGWY